MVEPSVRKQTAHAAVKSLESSIFIMPYIISHDFVRLTPFDCTSDIFYFLKNVFEYKASFFFVICQFYLYHHFFILFSTLFIYNS